MTLQQKIIYAQALSEPEKFVSVTERFLYATRGHRMVVTAPKCLEPSRTIFARLESHGAAVDRVNLR